MSVFRKKATFVDNTNASTVFCRSLAPQGEVYHEWLPYNSGTLNQVPDTAEDRRDWLAKRLRKRFSTIAENNRSLLTNLYGVKEGLDMQYAETFESCEYGSSLTSENLPVLFPFFE